MKVHAQVGLNASNVYGALHVP